MKNLLNLYRRRRANPAPKTPWELSTPLLRWSRNDAWTIRDAVEGTLVLGAIGSGKSSGSGRILVTAMLGRGRVVTFHGTGLTRERFIEWLQELLDKARRARPMGIELDTFLKTLRDQAKADGARLRNP